MKFRWEVMLLIARFFRVVPKDSLDMVDELLYEISEHEREAAYWEAKYWEREHSGRL